jgi:hypothetical protein
MKTPNALVIGCALVLASVAGCHKAESPKEVQHDVAQARQDAAADVADKQQDVANDVNKSADKVAADQRDVALAAAEGDHKVAIEKCEALGGDKQKACKDQADAALDTAKANIKAQAANAR